MSHNNNNNNNNWKQVMKSTTVAQWEEKFPFRDLLFFTKATTTAEAIESLKRGNVHSAPVVDTEKKNRLLGFVDVRDITTALLSALSNGKIEEDWQTWESKLEDRNQWTQVTENFMKSPVWTLVNASLTDKLRTYPPSTTLHEVAEQMTAHRLHHVVILDSNSDQPATVFSASDIMNFLSDHAATWKDHFNGRTVAEFVGKEAPITIAEESTAVQALQLLHRNQVSGIAVVDQKGSLVANFSATAVKGVYNTKEKALVPKSLFLPLHRFLLQQTRVAVLRAPISVPATESILSAIQKIALYRVHRLWIVDANNKPIGLITPFEILRLFVA